MTAVARLDKAGANRRAQRVRDGVNAVNDLIGTIVEIEERQDWLILGYKGWGDYFEAEFGPNQLRLSPEQRGVIVAVLAASGMSRRKIARWLGVDEKTLRNDAKGAEKSALPAADSQVKTNGPSDSPTTAAAASPTADGGTTLTEPPAAGPGASTAGEADRPGPAVTPTDITEDDVRPASGVVLPPASEPGVDEAGRPAEPEEPPAFSGEADPVQDGPGVPRPAPDPSDPAALLDWFAEQWEQVDADVSGPLLTDEDVILLEDSLNRIVFTFELLIKWRDRAQP